MNERKEGLKLALTCAVLLASAIAQPAWAVQHLISPGDNWQDLAAKLRPGDEIILMPGNHKPATFEGIAGEAGKPIVIRGVDAEHPGLIVADREGLRLNRPRHVLIQDVIVTGAKLNGIVIDFPRVTTVPGESESVQESDLLDGVWWRADVTLRNVTVERTGPTGQRQAVRLAGVSNIEIEQCRIEGWGGAAIEMVGCREVTVQSCRFNGLEGFSQMGGIVMRAGTREVVIERNRFDNAGEFVVAMGGVSDRPHFRPPVRPDEPGPRFEAIEIAVSECVFVGGGCTVVFANADGCSFRSNTVVRPKSFVMNLRADQRDKPFAPSQRHVFSSNLIVWEPGDLQKFALVMPGVVGERFIMEQNLWWSKESSEDRAKLGGLPGKQAFEQVWDIDPDLDEHMKPQTEAAKVYGAG